MCKFRYKALEDLKNAGIQIQQDQFPNKTELNDAGEWYVTYFFVLVVIT